MIHRRLLVSLAGLLLAGSLVGALAGVSLATRSQRANTGVVVGISDQFPSTFWETPSARGSAIPFWRTARDITLWDALKAKQQVSSARFLLPWNTDSLACFKTFTCFVDNWVTAVQNDGLAPFLVVQGQNSGRAPTAAEYRTHFGRLVDHFEQLAKNNGKPPITLWQSWNEPNEPINYTSDVPVGAGLAADFWREANDVLSSYCSQHGLSGCVVVAGEFANLVQGDYERGGYVYYYLEELQRSSGSLPPVAYPAVWGYHSYVDLLNGWRNTHVPYRYPRGLARECTTDLQPGLDYQQERGYAFQQTDCFVNFIAGTAHNGWDKGGAWHDPHVWLDEEGVFLGSPDGAGPLDSSFVALADDPVPETLNPNYPAPLGASLAGRRQVAAATEFTTFAARYGGLVQRVYYFDWGQGPLDGFDSALIDSTDKPRVTYCVLVSQPLGQCNGSRTYVPASPSGPKRTPPPCPRQPPGQPITCK